MVKLDTAHKSFIDQLKSENKSDSTVIAYKKDIEQLNDHLVSKGVNLVSEIELTHLEDFMKQLGEKDYTAKSISRKTNATRTFIKYLFINGHIKEDVSVMLKHPKLDHKAPRVLSKIEYRALRDAAKDDVRTYTMIEVLLQTGVTISEIAEIKIDHVDIKGDTGTLFVPKKNNKESRNIPLNKAVIDAVTKYLQTARTGLENAEHLFVTKTGNSLLVRNIRSTIDRFFKLAGVEKAKVNDLRHTFVSFHLQNGVNPNYLSKVAGHKRLSTTEKYLNYVDEKPVVGDKVVLEIL
jgi:site-specific recombinase XerD